MIRQASTMQAQAPKVSTVLHIVRGEIGIEDMFLLGEHIEETVWHRQPPFGLALIGCVGVS